MTIEFVLYIKYIKHNPTDSPSDIQRLLEDRRCWNTDEEDEMRQMRLKLRLRLRLKL